MSVSAVVQKKDGTIILLKKVDWDELFNSKDMEDWQSLSAVREDE